MAPVLAGIHLAPGSAEFEELSLQPSSAATEGRPTVFQNFEVISLVLSVGSAGYHVSLSFALYSYPMLLTSGTDSKKRS